MLIFWFLKPVGWEMPSSYWAGSQRVNGVLEAPRRGLFLKANKRCPCLETLLEKSQGSVHIFCGVRPKMFRCISQAFPPNVSSIRSHRPCFHSTQITFWKETVILFSPYIGGHCYSGNQEVEIDSKI